MLSQDILVANDSNEQAMSVGLLVAGAMVAMASLSSQDGQAEETQEQTTETVDLDQLLEEINFQKRRVSQMWDSIDHEEILESVEECGETLVQCCISFESVHISTCIVCPDGHCISAAMAHPYVDTEFDKSFDVLKANCGRVKCPFDGCEKHFEEEDLERILSPEVFRKVQKMQQRFDEYTVYITDLENGQEELETCIRQQFQKPDGTFSGYMCPRCNYGPIDKKACDDLTAHHHQKISSGVRISNRCPMCFFYTTSINRWKKWDGTFLSAERVAEIRQHRESASSEMKAKIEKAREDSSKYNTQKKKFASMNGFHVRSLMLAEISGQVLQANDNDEEESFDFEEVQQKLSQTDEQSTSENPEELLFQYNNCNDREGREALSIRLQKALVKSKSKEVDSGVVQHYSRLCRKSREAGNTLYNSMDQFEDVIDQYMATYTKNE